MNVGCIALAACVGLRAADLDFTGRYAGEGVSIELHAGTRGYEGVMRDHEVVMPLQGVVSGDRLVGSFSHDNQFTAFQATLAAERLSITVEGATLILAREALPKPPVLPAPRTATDGGNRSPSAGLVMHFRRISLEDRQVIRGEAVSFLVPVDWQVEGGIVWRPHPALPAGAQVRAFDPASLQQVEAFPSFPFTWGDNCGPGRLLPVGASWFGNEVHPPFNSALDALETTIIPRLRGAVRWRAVQRESLPRFASAQQQNSANPASRFDAARVRIAYVVNGKAVEEDLFAVMETARIPAGNIVIQIVDRVVAMRADQGQLDAARPLQLVIVNSSQVNLQWFNQYVQLVTILVRAKIQEIHAVGEFSRALAQASNQVSDERMQQWQEANRRGDRIDREWSEYIRGTETYNDPVRGEPVELPSSQNHAWVSRGGEYVLSDNPNFNPNIELSGTWVEMTPSP